MFSSAFVCLLAGLRKKLLFIKFGGKVAHGALKKLLRFGACNPHHGTLGLGSRLGEGTPYSA